MAIHANSTPTPERTLLREAAAPGRLLPASQPSPAQRADLLAILAMAPDMVEVARLRRPAMSDAIHALIEAMDVYDADPDLEDGADDELSGDESEPNLGAPDHMMSCKAHWWSFVDRICDQTRWANGCRDDREVECEDEGACIQSQPHDEESREPSLGAVEVHDDQSGWSRGGCNDGEVDDSDREPSLGSLHDIDQQLWASGKGSVEGDFDELQAPVVAGDPSYERARRYHDEAGALLDRHGLRRAGNVDRLVPIGPGVMWWPR